MPMKILLHFIWSTFVLTGTSLGIAQEKVIDQDAVSASNSRSITLNDGTRQEFEQLDFPSGVRRIYLRNCDIDDSSLKRLTGLTQLQYLSLEGSKINGEGLAVLCFASLESGIPSD